MVEVIQKKNEKMVAIVGGTLIDGSGKDPIDKSVVLVNGTIIQEVGQKNKIKLPNECEVIDVTGKTVMPGMMDLHVHLVFGHLNFSEVRLGIKLPAMVGHSMSMFGLIGFAYARSCLEMGFTTLRDAGDFGYVSVALRDIINSGILEGPRILVSGPFITATSGHGDFLPPWLTRIDMPLSNIVDGVDACLKAVRQRAKMKTDWIKIGSSGGVWECSDKEEFNHDELEAIVKEAHLKGKLVSAHCLWPEGTLGAVKAGVDTVEHGSFLTEEIIALMLKNGTYLVPTLYAPWAAVHRGREMGLTEDYIEKCRKDVFDPHMRSFRMALEAGVKIATGTDAGYTPCPHGSNAFELALLVEFGMTPMQAILAATMNAASALRLQNRLGTIEKGKWADIIVVDGNPLENIKVLQDKTKISLVMKEGSLCVDRL